MALLPCHGCIDILRYPDTSMNDSSSTSNPPQRSAVKDRAAGEGRNDEPLPVAHHGEVESGSTVEESDEGRLSTAELLAPSISVASQ